MKLSKVIEALEAIAPTRHAEAWDNVGLLAGDPQQDVSIGMMAIDYTAEVAAEARATSSDFVIAYHPPIFSPIKQLTAGHVVFDAIRRGVAIYSPHTAWDVAPGGTNDFLADALGLVDRLPLRASEIKSTQHKLITFVPREHVEKIVNALFKAGAGHIGDYHSCSFRTGGIGTFFGSEGTNPAVGAPGQLEHVEEMRLETIVPNAAIDEVVRALKRAHPYEEPVFDLVALSAPPAGVGAKAIGQGRIGTLARTPIPELLERIKRGLRLEHLLVAGPTEGDVSTVACCAGACGDLLNEAMEKKVELYLTGEMRHHDALRAAASGMTVVCTMHSNSERGSLRRLRDRLLALVPDLPLQLSQKDRDPFSIR